MRTHALSRSILLRVLGVCLVGTFVPLLGQVLGLAGSRGITPLRETMQLVGARAGLEGVLRAPTLFWLAASPQVVLQVLALFSLACEVALPWLYWIPGRARRLASLSGIALMAGLLAGGSFRGFSLLTAALLLLLWDDASLVRLVPRRWRPRLQVRPAPSPTRAGRVVGVAACTLVLASSVGPFVRQLLPVVPQLAPLASLRRALEPYHVTARYRMFDRVSPERYSLVVQGSRDGASWIDYEQRGLATAEEREQPRIVLDHDPLAFALWNFASAEPPSARGWLPALLVRLKEGEPSVRRLFAVDPFGDDPPRFVRACVFRYRFAGAEARARGLVRERELVRVISSAPSEMRVARGSGFPR